MSNSLLVANLPIKVKLERGSPDSVFVSKLAHVNLPLGEEENQRARDDLEFKIQIEKILASGGRSNYIQICAPFELYALTRICKPKHIVEVGVSAGISSAYFLRALEINGRGTLHSIDFPEKESRGEAVPRWGSWALPFGKDPGWAVPEYLKNKNWDLRIGKSSDVLPILLREIPRVDLFLYDIPYEIEEAKSDFKAVDGKMRKGSITLADNCLVPITWWARKRKATIYQRKNSGLRGFRVP
jgi:hypothetical protein